MPFHCMSCSDSWDCSIGIVEGRLKVQLQYLTLHITQSFFHIKYMAHDHPHTYDELNNSFCSMERNSMLNMWINCAHYLLFVFLCSLK